jgi:hypothetical protein
MKIKDTKIVLKVKSYKVGKYIRLLLNDSLEEFQNRSSSLIPRINMALRKNNAHDAKKFLEQYNEHLKRMSFHVEQAMRLLDNSVIPNLEIGENESGETITVDGNQNYIIQPGDSVAPFDSKKREKK